MDVFVRCPQKWVRGDFDPMRCSIEIWLETKQSGISSPPTLFDAPPLSRFIYSSLDSIQLKSSRDAEKQRMGGWAAKPNVFKLPLGAIPYTPDPDIGTASGYRTPGGGVSLRFYERILKIDREIRNLISTIATCWSGGRGVPNRYQCVGWLQQASEPTGGPKT
jgi:hypothetical protein